MRLGNVLTLRNNCFAAAMILAVGVACSGRAQILAASKIKDPVAQELQQTYINELRGLSADAEGIRFPYAFYFSETLDIDESKQKQLPQGSIRGSGHPMSRPSSPAPLPPFSRVCCRSVWSANWFRSERCSHSPSSRSARWCCGSPIPTCRARSGRRRSGWWRRWVRRPRSS